MTADGYGTPIAEEAASDGATGQEDRAPSQRPMQLPFPLASVPLLSFAFGAAACQLPQRVTAVTTAQDQIFFLYSDVPEGVPAGVVACKRAPNGALSECRNKAFSRAD
jgi:hypothetical protein